MKKQSLRLIRRLLVYPPILIFGGLLTAMIGRAFDNPLGLAITVVGGAAVVFGGYRFRVEQDSETQRREAASEGSKVSQKIDD